MCVGVLLLFKCVSCCHCAVVMVVMVVRGGWKLLTFVRGFTKNFFLFGFKFKMDYVIYIYYCVFLANYV